MFFTLWYISLIFYSPAGAWIFRTSFFSTLKNFSNSMSQELVFGHSRIWVFQNNYMYLLVRDIVMDFSFANWRGELTCFTIHLLTIGTISIIIMIWHHFNYLENSHMWSIPKCIYMESGNSDDMVFYQLQTFQSTTQGTASLMETYCKQRTECSL